MATTTNRRPPEAPQRGIEKAQVMGGQEIAEAAMSHWGRYAKAQAKKQLEQEERYKHSFWKANGLPRPTRRKSLPGFMQCVFNLARSKYESERKSIRKKLEKTYKSEYISIEKAAMGETRGATGGYLVPVDYTLALMEVIAEEAYIYPRATVLPMTTATMQCPKIDVETLQGVGTSAIVGGIKFNWGFEAALKETEPTFRALELTAWDLLGYTVTSNQFLQDIGPLGERTLFNLFGRAAAWYMEYAFLQGTGADSLMPLGVVNAPGAITVTRSTIGNIIQADIATMASNLLPFSWQHSIWMASPTCLKQIIQVTNYFVNDGNSSDGSCGNLLTRPLFVTEKLAALGAQGDLVLFDPRLYVIGQRTDIAIDVSNDDAFRNNQVTFRIWLRVDGKPWVSSSITLADGVTKVSPYVLLK